MRLRKITAQEYNLTIVARTTKHVAPTIKYFDGKTKIVDRLFTIEAGTYKWMILIPKELIPLVDNWNEVFLLGMKRHKIKAGDITPARLNYKHYNTYDDGVLFAFK